MFSLLSKLPPLVESWDDRKFLHWLITLVEVTAFDLTPYLPYCLFLSQIKQFDWIEIWSSVGRNDKYTKKIGLQIEGAEDSDLPTISI